MDQLRTITARGVRKVYGDVIALDGVDLDVTEGQVHGLIGPNGAGKTTLLGLLLGLSTADAGSLELLGHPLRRGGTVPEGVAGFVDGPGLYPQLTARQNLAAVARLRRRTHRQRVHRQVGDLLEEVGLEDVADDRVRGFSLGMRQRLGLAAALLAQPRVLVLDEPSNGLDPAGTRQVHRVLNRLAAGGTSIVLSSHHVDDLAVLCHDVTLLVAGRLVFSGPVAKLVAEAGELDHRLRTSDPGAARQVVATTPGVRLLPENLPAPDLPAGDLLVRGAGPALEDLVARLVQASVGVRELSPVVPALEAAFLDLTGAGR